LWEGYLKQASFLSSLSFKKKRVVFTIDVEARESIIERK